MRAANSLRLTTRLAGTSFRVLATPARLCLAGPSFTAPREIELLIGHPDAIQGNRARRTHSNAPTLPDGCQFNDRSPSLTGSHRGASRWSIVTATGKDSPATMNSAL